MELENLNFKILTVLGRGRGPLNVRIEKNKIKGGFIETRTHTSKSNYRQNYAIFFLWPQLPPKLSDFDDIYTVRKVLKSTF